MLWLNISRDCDRGGAVTQPWTLPPPPQLPCHHHFPECKETSQMLNTLYEGSQVTEVLKDRSPHLDKEKLCQALPTPGVCGGSQAPGSLNPQGGEGFLPDPGPSLYHGCPCSPQVATCEHHPEQLLLHLGTPRRALVQQGVRTRPDPCAFFQMCGRALWTQ